MGTPDRDSADAALLRRTTAGGTPGGGRSGRLLGPGVRLPGSGAFGPGRRGGSALALAPGSGRGLLPPDGRSAPRCRNSGSPCSGVRLGRPTRTETVSIPMAVPAGCRFRVVSGPGLRRKDDGPMAEVRRLRLRIQGMSCAGSSVRRKGSVPRRSPRITVAARPASRFPAGSRRARSLLRCGGWDTVWWAWRRRSPSPTAAAAAVDGIAGLGRVAEWTKGRVNAR